MDRLSLDDDVSSYLLLLFLSSRFISQANVLRDNDGRKILKRTVKSYSKDDTFI